MKSKRIKSKETDTNIVNRKTAVNDVDPSRFTVHGSRFTIHDSRIHLACLVFLIVIIYANTLNAPFQWDESQFIINNPIIKDLHYFSNPSDAKGFKLYSSFIGRYIGYLTFALNYRIHGLSVTGYHIVNIAIHIANSILVYFLVLLTFRGSGTRDQGSGTWDQGPETRFPVPGSQSPVPGSQSPVPGSQSPVPGSQSPVPGSQSPVPGSQSPVPGSQSPGSQSPVPGSQSPVPGSQSPVPGSQSPVPGSQSPVPGSQSLVPDPWSLSPNLVAFFSAAIFAVHPLQTEAVTYVFQRFASLAAMFYLMSVVMYIKARIASRQWAIGNGTNSKNVMPSSRITFLLISLVSAVLAMKTKENAFTLPLVIVLYEFCFFSDSPSPIAHRQSSLVSRFYYLVPILLTLLIVPLTLMGLTGSHHLNPGSYGSQVFSRNAYLFSQFRVIVTYLRLLFFPVNQHIDYDYPLFKSFFDLPVILSFLFLSALFGLGVWLILAKNRRPSPIAHSPLPGVSRPLRLIGFGILWFFITLSVESSVIPLPMLIDEYRVYLPSVGLIISAVTGVFLVFSRFTIHVSRPLVSRSLIAALVVAVGVLSVATHLRNEVWGDNISFWEDAAKKSPGNARAHNNLGFLYTQKKLYAKATNEINIAISLSPDYADAHHNLGVIYQDLGMFDKAIEQYLFAIMLNSEFEETYFNLGTIYQARNMFDKAIEQYLFAIKIRPDYIEAHYNLGVIYQASNMLDKAIEQYLIVVDLNPDFAEAHFNLGTIYQARNMLDKAIEQYLSAIDLKPDYVKAHNNLGVVYEARNMFDKAIEQYRVASNLKPNDAEAHFNLGSVYYKLGQFEKAREELTSGLKIKPDDRQAQQLLHQAIGNDRQ